MRLLLLISVFFTLTVNNLSAQKNNEEISLFNAVIDVYGNTISGIMAIKQESDDKFRILFTTVAGPKLLDMYITKDNYEVIYAVKKLNKKIILKLFQKDFALVTGLYFDKSYFDMPKEEYRIPLNKKDTAIYHAGMTGEYFNINKAEYKGKKKILFDAVYEYDKYTIEKIVLQHYNFKMTITLNRFNQ